MIYEIEITPVPKPRMVASDRYKNRKVVNNYWAFKKEFVLLAKIAGLYNLNQTIGVTFIMPMPKSWSQKKRDKVNNSPHQQRPDLDNLIKSVKDCLCEEDSYIWKYTGMKKIWGKKGKIIIET